MVDGHKKNDKEIVKLLNDFQWYFLLVLNVDGYHYTHTKVFNEIDLKIFSKRFQLQDRMWRKSRSTHTGTTCVG